MTIFWFALIAVSACNKSTTDPDVGTDSDVETPDRTVETTLPTTTTPSIPEDTVDVRVDMADPAADPDSENTQMCVDEQGDIVVLWVDDRDGVPALWMNRSTDLGVTWSPLAVRVNQGNGAVSAPTLACSNDGVFVAWEDDRHDIGGATKIYFNRSLDDGATWLVEDLPIQVGLDSDHYSLGPQIAIAGSAVYVVWFNDASGAYDIHLSSSGDRGESWSGPVRVDSDEPAGVSWSGWPTLAAAPLGKVYVAWEDSRNGAADIYFASSDNAGSSFHADIRLDSGDDAGSAHSLKPRLAADGDSVYVVWEDQRNGQGQDILLNYSGDGGVSWAGGASRLDSDNAGFFDSVDPEIVVADSKAHVVWRDNRDGGFDVYYRQAIGTMGGGAEVRLDLTEAAGAGDAMGAILAIGDGEVVVGFEDARGPVQQGYNDLHYNHGALDGSFAAADVRIDSLTDSSSYKTDLNLAVHGQKVFAAWTDGRYGTSDILFRAFDVGTSAVVNPADIAVANPSPIPATDYTDHAMRAGSPQVDVLFVVDNSSGMSQAQDQLTASFPVFMDYFLGSGLDYHIGVISTDMADPAHSGKLQSAMGNLYIDQNTVDPVGVFTSMASMGQSGSPDERGRDAAYTALEVLKTGYNTGFYRDDATLHIAVLSSEDDHSTDVTINEVANYLLSLKPLAELVTFSSVVSPTPLCPGANEPGTQYEQLTTLVGGMLWSFCSADYDTFMEQMAVGASGLDREFYLSRLPVDGTLGVRVDDNAVLFAFVEGADWIYSPSRNSIVFIEYVPPPNADVLLDYTVLGAVP